MTNIFVGPCKMTLVLARTPHRMSKPETFPTLITIALSYFVFNVIKRLTLLRGASCLSLCAACQNIAEQVRFAAERNKQELNMKQ